jgi:hypothetical protein
MVYYLDSDVVDTEKIIEEYIQKLKDYNQLSSLNDNERKLGKSLIDLFENYDSIFVGSDNKKFNKNLVLLSLREMTNLSTKEIRLSMRKFKKLYFDFVKKIDSR